MEGPVIIVSRRRHLLCGLRPHGLASCYHLKAAEARRADSRAQQMMAPSASKEPSRSFMLQRQPAASKEGTGKRWWHGLADFLESFCERIALSRAEDRMGLALESPTLELEVFLRHSQRRRQQRQWQQRCRSVVVGVQYSIQYCTITGLLTCCVWSKCAAAWGAGGVQLGC